MNSNQDEIDIKNGNKNEIHKTIVIPYINNQQPNSKTDISQKEENPKPRTIPQKKDGKLKRNIFLAIILSGIVIIGLIIFLSIHFSKKPQQNEKPIEEKTDQLGGRNDEKTENEIKEESEEKSVENEEKKVPKPEIITREEAMKVFNPNFEIKSKEDSLTQLLLKSKQTYNTVSNGAETSYTTISKAKYDIYTLNSTSPGEDKDFYSLKYTTVVTINSLCNKISTTSSENDCDLKKYLDLNIKNTNNLRRIEEGNIEQINDVILPICLIEHTNTNIILSVTCPKTLSSNLKNDIILAFRSIKPDSANSINDDETVAGTKKEIKDDKIYINSFNKECNNYNGDPNKKMSCESIRNIITDKEGNLISSEKISKSETIMDENNKYSNNLIYNFEDISNQNSAEFDPNNYKSNLNTIFDLTKNLLEKDNYISDGSFGEILDFIMKAEDNNTKSNIRNLIEISDENPGINEEQLFSKTQYDINMTLNMKNDLGFGELENAKAISTFNTGDQSNLLSNKEINTKLAETLNKFITLSKAGNKMATELLEQLNEPLLNLEDIINTNITDLNSLLAFKELVAIFDSTYAVNNLVTLPPTFITAAENLYSGEKGLNTLYNDIPYITNNMRKQLKEDVSSFLIKSHELLYNIFQNLTEATNSLSSEKSRIAEISSYYLNDTDTSYVDIIKQAKEIMDNYYIKEKELIEPLVDDMLNKFPETTLIEMLKNAQLSLEKVSDKIDMGDLTISLANAEDYKNIIKNIYNSNQKVDEIVQKVQVKFKESINLQSNGYFETQKEINSNKQSYGAISERAMNISYTLDNNELIDKTFDNIMVYFREQFIALLNYMDKSKKEKFPLKEDVLTTSSFPSTYINEIDNNLKKQKMNIINFIKDENKEYLDLINESIDSAKSSNGQNLEQIINNIQIDLTDFNLNNLNKVYNESLINTFNSINSLIEDNKNYAVQYLTSVKNAGSTHRTQCFINKYNIYVNNLYQTRSYISNDLKNNLVQKYKNIITQVRAKLQTIKSNQVIKRYIKQLPFAENHLRIIDNLYERLEKHISDSLFNQNYLSTINNYVSQTYDNINQIEQTLKNLYNSLSSKTYSSSTEYDYYKLAVYYYRCCRFKFGRCWSHTTCSSYYYAGYKVGNTNNHLNLKEINLDKYTNAFDLLYEDFYSKFNNNILSYNNVLIEINDPLDLIKQNIIDKNKNNNYLNDISENINSIINNKLGNNLLNSSYNYYKNDLNENLPLELNSILEKWKDTYDEIYEYLDSNISNFKSSISEFSLFSVFYYNTFSQKISIDYFDSIINKTKNDFNYTIKYYYNLIISKVNKTYSYILNNIPVNEKPFDEIIILRTNEIKQSYNNLLNLILDSKNQILQKIYQLNTIGVNEKNFFLMNNYINDNIESINRDLGTKVSQLAIFTNQHLKEDSDEIIVARFYLENAQNGKQIKENYEQVNKATFIDLQNDVYQKLIEDIWEIDQDDLIRNIKNILINSNEKILNNFKYEKEKYINILENKIYEEYDFDMKDNELTGKEKLEKEIDIIYSNGLKCLDSNSKNIIYGYLNEALNSIKEHISNEAKRISGSLTSYSKNYNAILNRLNDYKTSINNQFEDTILSEINDFYTKVIKKFYEKYIVENLDIFQNLAKEKDFKEYKFLNISINLKEIVNENLELLINDYKTLSKNQINFSHQKKYQELNELFNFSNIHNIINTEIDNAYTNILLPVLQKFAIYNSGDEQVFDFDLSDNILNDINNEINQKIEHTKQNIGEMKGNDYLEEHYNIPPDFSNVKIKQLKEIENLCDIFYNSFNDQELKEFKQVVLENIKNNFKIIIDNFVPSFGKDFFDRILEYNEIQRIRSLYNNLQYSLIQSIVYYSSLSQMQLKKNSPIQLPEDIKLRILSLNNLDATVKSKNIQVISSLNTKIELFFEETKNYIVEKYINEMKNDPNIELNFQKNIRTIIEQTLDGKREIFEDEYLNLMNTFIKTPFVEEYTEIINKETNNMNYFIEKTKEEGRVYINQIFTLNTDSVLSDIEKKLNNTVKAVELYNAHFKTFKISPEVQNYLDNFGRDVIYPCYEYIKGLLDTATKEIIIENLNKKAEEFENEYSIEKFENKTNQINIELNNYFDSMNNSLKSYAPSEDDYKINLEEEMSNYQRIRRLEETDDKRLNYDQQAADYKFQQLKKTSVLIIDFIESFNLFSNFEDKLNKYINDINYQKSLSENIIIKDTDNYDELSTTLYELNSHSLKYYDKVNKTYSKLKEFIINRIQLINEYIDNCSDITFKTIAQKYKDIKDEFNPTDNKIEEDKDNVVVDDYNKEADDDLSYTIKTKIEKYSIDDEFNLDIIFEGDEIKKPKVIGKIVNKNKPKSFEIDIFSKNGNFCGKLGRRINAAFNNVSLLTVINFDGGLNEAKINSNFSYDEYAVRTNFYETIEINEVIEIGGIIFPLPTQCLEESREKPENEKDLEIIPSKNNNEEKAYTF